MKAIYINLDPYLQEVADWLNAGKPGTAPCFDPLPLAVTIPLGESAAIAIPHNDGNETNPVIVPVGSDPVTIDIVPDFSGEPIATGVQLGLSAFTSASYPALYDIYQISGGSISVEIPLTDEDGETITIPFTVLVRREQASGPVDLVDFTPPTAAPTAAQINAALGGTEIDGKPLNGVNLEGAVWNGVVLALAQDNAFTIGAGES